MIESIAHRLKMLGLDASEFQGIGMGSPGVVDREKKVQLSVPTTELEDPSTSQKKRSKLPFIFHSLSITMPTLLLWWTLERGENQPDVVFMTLGTGVGGGIVAEGRLLHGGRGAAGELGHITVDFDDPIQWPVVKKGCLETVASATGIVNLTRRYADEYEGDSQLKVLIDNGEEVTAKTVFDLAKKAMLLLWSSTRTSHVTLDLLLLTSVQPWTHLRSLSVVGFRCWRLPLGWCAGLWRKLIPTSAWIYSIGTCYLGNDAGVIGAASLVLQ